MILAELNTEHFQFKAVGPSIVDAKTKVVAAFTRHLVQHDSTPADWAGAVGQNYRTSSLELFAAALEDWYGINTYDFGPTNDVALRDGEKI